MLTEVAFIEITDNILSNLYNGQEKMSTEKAYWATSREQILYTFDIVGVDLCQG